MPRISKYLSFFKNMSKEKKNTLYNENSLKTSEKSKITKMLNSVENSKRKVPNQMPNSKDKTHQTKDNNCHIPDCYRHFQM